MKYFASLPFVCLIAACSSGPPAVQKDLIIFSSRETGLQGSFHSASYTEAKVKARVAELACTSGKLAEFTKTDAGDGGFTFSAQCKGARKYEATSGFVVNDIAGSGHITTVLDDKLVQIKL